MTVDPKLKPFKVLIPPRVQVPTMVEVENRSLAGAALTGIRSFSVAVDAP